MFRIWRGRRARDRRHEQRRWLDRDWRGDEHGGKQCRRGKHEHGRFCGDWRLGRNRWLACQRREHGHGHGWHSRKRRHGDRWNAEHRRRNRHRRFGCDRRRHSTGGITSTGGTTATSGALLGESQALEAQRPRGEQFQPVGHSPLEAQVLPAVRLVRAARAVPAEPPVRAARQRPSAGPCDIYASGNTPCVAAHSTVRALFGAYSGNLYQVKRASDNTTKDIAVLTPGGFADSAAQDTFCSGTTCTISIIYDQSGKGNHLTKAPAGQRKNTPDNEADATALKLTVGGHTVYGVHIVAGDGYRNDKTSGIATGDQPETEYMVTSGNFYNSGCCFDYGNAETNNTDDGAATMEAVYFGNSTSWGKGTGTGPWVMADLENGLFAGGDKGPTTTNTPLTSTYVTAMVIGKSGTFALKGGNAQSGTLTTMYDGARPNGYTTMKKQGAIILGIGGDNTDSAQGNFFEGCMTSGASSTATDDAVQANIVAAGYGN